MPNLSHLSQKFEVGACQSQRIGKMPRPSASVCCRQISASSFVRWMWGQSQSIGSPNAQRAVHHPWGVSTTCSDIAGSSDLWGGLTPEDSSRIGLDLGEQIGDASGLDEVVDVPSAVAVAAVQRPLVRCGIEAELRDR